MIAQSYLLSQTHTHTYLCVINSTNDLFTDTLDSRYSALINAFRVVESGVTMSLESVLRTDTQTSMDPILAFADTLTLTVVINRPGLVVRCVGKKTSLSASKNSFIQHHSLFAKQVHEFHR